jgi:hypothetical protein
VAEGVAYPKLMIPSTLLRLLSASSCGIVPGPAPYPSLEG